jgi:hypothetical protein
MLFEQLPRYPLQNTLQRLRIQKGLS